MCAMVEKASLKFTFSPLPFKPPGCVSTGNYKMLVINMYATVSTGYMEFPPVTMWVSSGLLGSLLLKVDYVAMLDFRYVLANVRLCACMEHADGRLIPRG